MIDKVHKFLLWAVPVLWLTTFVYSMFNKQWDYATLEALLASYSLDRAIREYPN